MEETLASAPYMVLPGNHEAACHTYTNVGCSAARTNFTVYRTRWSMPYESSKGVNNMWYSFNYKNMHIVSIDTETDYDGAPCTYGNIIGNQAGPFGDQLAWLKVSCVHFLLWSAVFVYCSVACGRCGDRFLCIKYMHAMDFMLHLDIRAYSANYFQYEQMHILDCLLFLLSSQADLAKANTPENRAVRPWLIVVGHRPMYGNSATDFPPGVQAATRKAFEDLWKDYDVDMYITGHIHAYQRFWPVYNDKKMGSDYINPKATVHVANGAAGNEESHDTKFPPTMNYTNVLDYQHFGYALLDVVSDTTLTYTFIASSDDTILDQFTVVKDPLPPVSGDDDGGNDGGGNDNDDGESIPVGPEEPASENEEEEADGGEGEDWTDIQILVE